MMRAAALGPEAAVGVRRRALAEIDLRHPRSRRPSLEPGEQLLNELRVALAEARIVEAEPLGQEPEDLGVRHGLAARLDRGLVLRQVVVAPREDHVEMLELCRGREDDVGVLRGVGHELLEHDGEQVLAAQALEHPLLVGATTAGFEFQQTQRLDRRVQPGSVSASPSWDMLTSAPAGAQVRRAERARS